MSRGGRGGGGGGSRLNGIPFDVDPTLEEQMNAFRESQREDDDDWTKTLYPPMTVNLPPPPTEKEKREVNAWRQHRAAMRNGPFFIDTPLTGKRDLATFNAFEDAATYGNKRTKRTGGLPNLKQVPIVKECLPKELWDVVSDNEEGGDDAEAPRKNLAFLKKKRLDKLAQFDDGADIDAVNIDDDDDQANQEEDGGDGVEIPEDDDYSEDDDDLGNDYNAEKYFDDGDGVDDDGDDGGGEDAWQRERVAAKAPKCAGDLGNFELSAKRDRDGKSKIEDLRRQDIRAGRDEVFSETRRAVHASDALDRRMLEVYGVVEPKEKNEFAEMRKPWHAGQPGAKQMRKRTLQNLS